MNTIKACSLIFLVLVGEISTSSAATPTVTWSKQKVQHVLIPGFHLQEAVAFTSSQALSGAAVTVVPALRPYVTVSTVLPSALAAGVPYLVTFDINIPSGTPLGSIIQGAVRVTMQTATVPVPLPVLLEVQASGFQLPDPLTLVQDSDGKIYPVNELLFLLHDDSNILVAQQIAAELGGQIIGASPTDNVYQLQLPTGQTGQLDAVLLQLSTDQRVEAVTKNVGFTLFSVPSDLANLEVCHPGYADAYKKVRTLDSWDFIASQGIAPSFVNIGIIDSGVDRSHPEFSRVLIRAFDPLISFNDSFGHGTAVSGIIGAGNDLTFSSCVPPSDVQMNGIISGVPGAAYFLDVYSSPPVSFLGGRTPLFAVEFNLFTDLLGSDLANGVHVSTINVSSGIAINTSDPILGPINALILDGLTKIFRRAVHNHPHILFVFAAGENDADAQSTTPANLGGPNGESNALTVAATDLRDQRAVGQSWGSSNFGNNVDISAPGVDIYAPALFSAPLDIHDYFVFFGGTSGSAPMVTGAAAILKAIEGATPTKTLPPQRIKSILISGTDPIQTGEPAKRLGTGCYANPADPVNTGCRLNILRAVQQALVPPAVTRIYVSVLAENRVAVVDPGSDQVIDSIPLSSAPQGIAISRDGSFLLAVLPNAGQLAKVHLPDKTVTQMNITGAGAVAILPSGQKAYVTQNTATGTSVSVIDPSTLTLTKSIMLAGPASVVNNINIAPSGLKAYVSFGGIDTTVGVIDTTLDQLKAPINAQTYYHDEVAFSADSSLAVVSSRGANCPTNGGFSQLDAVNDVFLSADNLTSGKIGVKVSTDKTKAYLPDTCGAGNLLVFDLATNTLVDSIPTGLTNEPSAVLLFENTGKAFLVDETGTMSDVNLSARSHFTFPLSTAPFGGILPWTVASGPASQ